MPWNVGSVAHFAWEGLNDVPSTISGQVMQDLALQSVFFVNNFNHVSLSGNSISDQFFNPIINLTKAWTLARMADVGAQFSWHLGDFRVDKGGTNNTEAIQVQAFFDMAIAELKSIGVPLRYAISQA